MANGRIVVAPRQIIPAAVDNMRWDQSVQTFTSAADRDNQFPAPHEGATCYTEDTRTHWSRRGGAWQPQPRETVTAPTWFDGTAPPAAQGLLTSSGYGVAVTNTGGQGSFVVPGLNRLLSFTATTVFAAAAPNRFIQVANRMMNPASVYIWLISNGQLANAQSVAFSYIAIGI